MSEELTPHHYHPSTMHMGDCSICGNLADDPIHAWPYGEPAIALDPAPTARADGEAIGYMREALEWYGNLPKEWTVNAGGGLTYGTLHLLGEKARVTLARIDDAALASPPPALEAAALPVKAVAYRVRRYRLDPPSEWIVSNHKPGYADADGWECEPLIPAARLAALTAELALALDTVDMNYHHCKQAEERADAATAELEQVKRERNELGKAWDSADARATAAESALSASEREREKLTQKLTEKWSLFTRINQLSSPNPERTFDNMIADMDYIDAITRAALQADGGGQ